MFALCTPGVGVFALCTPGVGVFDLCTPGVGVFDLCTPGVGVFDLCTPGVGVFDLCTPGVGVLVIAGSSESQWWWHWDFNPPSPQEKFPSPEAAWLFFLLSIECRGHIRTYVRTYVVQWTPSNTTTLGTRQSVLVTEVASFQG